MNDIVNTPNVAERLRLARSNAGITQEGAAEVLGISRPTLIAIEQGERKVRIDELRKLASAYDVSVNDLLRASAVHVDLVAKFRRNSRKKHNADGEDTVRLLNRLATASIELEQRLGRKQNIAVPPAVDILPGALEQQAEDLALDLRHRLGLGLAPLTDVVSLVELELGVRIFFRELGANVSGAFAYDSSIGPCMLINSAHPRERQVNTIVHELGHFMCARETPEIVEDSRAAQSREERFVNLFAQAFLMPAAAIRQRFREHAASGTFQLRSLVLLAHGFGVSFEAMTRRMEALQLLKPGTFDSLKARKFAVEDAKKSLGLATLRLQSVAPRLMVLAAEAYHRGILSEGQLSKMLALDRIQFREQIDLLGGAELDDAIAIET